MIAWAVLGQFLFCSTSRMVKMTDLGLRVAFPVLHMHSSSALLFSNLVDSDLDLTVLD